MTALADIETAARAVHLDVLGAYHPDKTSAAPAGTGTLILLGPLEPGFWPALQRAPEFRDAAPDPVDRWSLRVIGALAGALGARALFPFTGPPYQPFLRWAEESRRAWPSPVQFLVHDNAGLFVSYRGALVLEARLSLPTPPPASPCESCAAKPCLTACPAGALRDGAYDLAACHALLETPAGAACMSAGCAVRRSCPISQQYGRLAAQSALHMAAFHKG